MKIEKLTENKIRVIINSDELGNSNDINLHNIMSKAMETQEIFSNILKQAEKEVDFHTDGCKLLIEAFSSLEDIFVLTITRYYPETSQTNPKKKLVVKRKTFNKMASQAICHFETFDAFCEFCTSLKSLHKINVVTYYLVLKNINTQTENLKLFYSTLSEFGKLLSCSEHFEAKLLEHGKIIIKKNAIEMGSRFFT